VHGRRHLLQRGDAVQAPRQNAETSPVLRRREADLAPEQSTEEAGVLIAHLPGDRFNRQLSAFQQLLGFLQPQGMDVIQRRQSRGQGEAALEGPLRQPADAHHGAHRRLFLVMLRGPFLTTRDHRISQLAGAHHRGVGQRAGRVPVEQVQPRHLHRLARTDETGDEKQPQCMPAAATARHHQALADAGADQCLVRMPVHLRVLAAQAIAVAPVRSPFASGQEPGTRQQHGS